MHENSAGYNGYFFRNNMNALARAKMPQYSKNEYEALQSMAETEPLNNSLVVTSKNHDHQHKQLTNLLSEV